MRLWICPECAQGKHQNCTGQALDESRDNIVPCECRHVSSGNGDSK